jgi:hypothetical protein
MKKAHGMMKILLQKIRHREMVILLIPYVVMMSLGYHH